MATIKNLIFVGKLTAQQEALSAKIEQRRKNNEGETERYRNGAYHCA